MEEAAAVAVAAVTEAVAAVAAAAAAGVEDKRSMDDEKTNENKINIMTPPKFSLLASAIVISCLSGAGLPRGAGEEANRTKARRRQGNSQNGEKGFDSPKQAADALIQVAANLMSLPQRKFSARTARISLLQRTPFKTRTGRLSLQPRQKKRPLSKSTSKIRSAPFSWWVTMIFRFPFRS